MTFLIQDNGAGITPEKLEEIDTALSNNENDEGFAYGLFNVDKHIKLYYSIDKGLVMESSPGAGTRVMFTLPIIKEMQNV